MCHYLAGTGWISIHNTLISFRWATKLKTLLLSRMRDCMQRGRGKNGSPVVQTEVKDTFCQDKSVPDQVQTKFFQRKAYTVISKYLELTFVWKDWWKKVKTQSKLKSNNERDAFTSIYVFAAKVSPIEKHQLNLVAFVEGNEKDEKQQDRSQPSCKLHGVHELCWGQHTKHRKEEQCQNCTFPLFFHDFLVRFFKNQWIHRVHLHLLESKKVIRILLVQLKAESAFRGTRRTMCLRRMSARKNKNKKWGLYFSTVQ